MEPSKRDLAIDILKGIGMLTVVANHSNFGHMFSIFVSSFHMQLFFFISGLLFVSGKYSFKDFARKRIRGLLIPYVFFALLTIVFVVSINLFSKAEVFEYKSIFLGIIWSNQGIFPITGALWFLQALFIVECLYFVLDKINIKYFHLITSLLFALFALILAKFELKLPFSMDSAFGAFAFYGFGHYLSKKRAVFNRVTSFFFKNFFSIIPFAFLMLVNCCFILLNGEVNPRIAEYSNFVLYYFNAGLAILILYSISIKLSQVSKGFVTKYLSFVGVNSIVFLGMNQILIFSLYNLSVIVFDFSSSIFKGTRNILIFVVSMALMTLIAKLFSFKPLKKCIGK